MGENEATTLNEESFEVFFASTPLAKTKQNEPTSEEREIQELEELRLKKEEM